VNIRLVVIAALGLALGLYLIAYVGLGAVFAAVVAVGWGGFAILCLYGLAMFVVLGAAWCALPPGATLRQLRVFTWARMVRDAAAEVLPFSQLGGMVLGVRAAILHGIASPLASASMIVDVTTEMVAQFVYIALGVLMLSTRVPQNSAALSLTRAFMIGLVIAAVGGGIFMALQRQGQWISRKVAPRLFPGAAAATAAVTVALDAIYASRVRVSLSAALHFIGWIASAFGTWIALRLMGTHVDLVAVMAIESLVYAARSAAFLVPNALGVQEAAYAVLAPLFGVGAEFGLAVSLLKRARDIAVGVPILLIWQGVEGQRAFASKASGNP
jgi:glycosyltransferase 2 family protein